MLAQNFKSAADLNISEAQKDALCKVLVLLETGHLEHAERPSGRFLDAEEGCNFTGHFNMDSWNIVKHGCGTIACIGGTAELLAGKKIFNGGDDISARELERLFYPPGVRDWEAITTDQAATALRSYLTTGEARWDLAVA